jgi:hypothetical protein
MKTTTQNNSTMTVSFVNLTPHPIRLRVDLTNQEPKPLDSDIIIPKSGVECRISTQSGVEMGSLNGVQLFSADKVGEVENLPEPKPNTIYIVSGKVGDAVNGRADVVRPGTGPNDNGIRSEKGFVYAATRLIRVC